MSGKLQISLSLLILSAGIFWSLYGTMPKAVSDAAVPETKFSTSRAFEHVEAMVWQPHYVGSPAHSEVRNYIVSELQDMGLLVQTQEAISINGFGVVTRPENILARIDGSGSGKALLLLSHYDSAVHSSYGASDAASGVATILEGIRAFLASGIEPKNDIIIVFTDAEEVGLNGAGLFVSDHPWSKDVGLALNFEARGSGGPSFMLLETNSGNKKLIEHFIKADPQFPVTNSLAYSVYKMLPNDTDLTVLREKANIPGFNFAFIGDHFDYHTARDTPGNLDKNSLAHQGSYLMPLLEYFSQVPLENLESEEDFIYFDFPVFQMLSYPFSWISPMLYLAIFMFVLLLIYGFFKRRLNPILVLKGFLPVLISISMAGLLVYLLWQTCMMIYPQYEEMLHGFTYNGYYYIYASVFLALSVCFYAYGTFQKAGNTKEYFIAPLFLWLIICVGAAFYLKGAAYFVLPVFFGLLQLFILIQQRRPNPIGLSLLSLPAIFIVMPFIISFPVALGLKMLFLAAILVVLLWVLLWPVFGFFNWNRSLGLLCSLAFIALLLVAHFKSDFTEQRPKPNSLVYILDADKSSATWNTYDHLLDSWTKPYFPEPEKAAGEILSFSSKYNSNFTKVSEAPVIQVPEPTVLIEDLGVDSVGNIAYRMKIAPNREINRIDLFTEEIVDFEKFMINGQKAPFFIQAKDSLHIFKNRWSKRLLTYFAVGRDTLRLEFSIKKGRVPNMVLYESSYDLLENESLDVPSRTEAMIPKPFVSNDAVIVRKRINLE